MTEGLTGMNGAEALVGTLLDDGAGVVFANPGTSEMHFVAALDAHPQMRCILALFEGGATGAADGYARVTGRVGVTLLHLAPGLGNGWANLHNARKAGVPLLNVVGEHAGRHLRYDAPLKGDLAGLARSISDWVRITDRGAVGRDAADGLRAARARGGQIATLILPADAAWSEGDAPDRAAPPPPMDTPSAAAIAAAAARLMRPGAALLPGGPGLYGGGAELAARIAARTGCRLLAPYFVPRIVEGAGAPDWVSLPYGPAECRARLEGLSEIVVVGERHPVNFFAYPDTPSSPVPEDCSVDVLCPPGWDTMATLEGLAAAVGVTGAETVPRRALALPEAMSGPLTAGGLAAALARTLPEGSLCVNEAITAASAMMPLLERARPHERLDLRGGSIGQGLPLATGAAVGAPGRRVLAVVGDGSAMYTIQSLWTMAREQLDVTVVIVANRGYQILRTEMANLGVERYGANAERMFDVVAPELDFTALARGHGVSAERVTEAEALEAALVRSYATPGPHLIEAVL